MPGPKTFFILQGHGLVKLHQYKHISMDLKNVHLRAINCNECNYKESRALPVPMIKLFYTDDHIYHESEISENFGNFWPVPCNNWQVV